ncbi:MAG TPA: hypothetical protein VMF55_13555, partial [Solirubrobacterales bacterium]|nr:hypothetical protein [Solirubrobacterales bacterium]
MKARSTLSLVLFALVGVALLAGCGGGGSTGSGGSSGGFAATAEAACAKADKQIAALGTPQQADVLEYMERTEAVIEE